VGQNLIPDDIFLSRSKIQSDCNSVHPCQLLQTIQLHKSGMKKLKVVEVLQYNGVNMKVISTKRTTVEMVLLH